MLGATGGIHFVLYAASFTCTLASASQRKEKQASCYRHLLVQLKCSPSSSFLSLTDIMLQSASLMKDIYTGTPLISKQTRRVTITEDCSFLIKKIPHNDLQFRMFHSLATISRICHLKGFFSCRFVDVFTAASVLNVRFSLGISKKWQLCSPTATPLGLQRENRKCLLISQISGDREKKHLMRPSVVSVS